VEARLKEIKIINPTCPVGNLNALHLKNVKANIVTIVLLLFFSLLCSLLHGVGKWGKKMPQEDCRHLCACYMLASEVMCF